MYYNKLIKYLVISMSLLVITISILSQIEIIPNFELLNFCTVVLALEILLLSYNSYKLGRKKLEFFILSITGVFIFISTVIRISTQLY